MRAAARVLIEQRADLVLGNGERGGEKRHVGAAARRDPGIAERAGIGVLGAVDNVQAFVRECEFSGSGKDDDDFEAGLWALRDDQRETHSLRSHSRLTGRPTISIAADDERHYGGQHFRTPLRLARSDSLTRATQV